jgi:hypothetical protein
MIDRLSWRGGEENTYLQFQELNLGHPAYILFIHSFIHSFHWHVQNATIPCCSQELLPFFSVIYFSLPLFSTNYSSILPYFILPAISSSSPWSCWFQIHIQYPFGNSIFFHSLYMPKPL